MQRIKQKSNRVQAFLWGDYPGAPVDYLMAIALAYGLMVVMVAADLVGRV